MHLLDQIVAQKRREVAEAREIYPPAFLEKSIFYRTTPVSLKKYLSRPDRVGVIAEIKRRSPSRGLLSPNISVERLSIGYMQAGASALSILTDAQFFGGCNDDLTMARRYNFCPILRKDFVIDEYQVREAKAIGADAVLLIARILTPAEVRSLAECAHDLGLEVLLEVHAERELEEHLCDGIDVVGVNNRNLDTLAVDPSLSFALAGKIPRAFMRISESGISSAETMLALMKQGYDGFLIGEAFMSKSRPAEACAALIDALRRELEREGR